MSEIPATDTQREAKSRSADPRLVGTWRILRFENVGPEGQVSRPYGEHPVGHLVYDDATGCVSFQIAHSPIQRRPAFCDSGAQNGYAAYLGAYQVDADRQVVTHAIQGSTIPCLIGTTEPRRYRIIEDRLIVELRAPAGSHFRREFRRVASAMGLDTTKLTISFK